MKGLDVTGTAGRGQGRWPLGSKTWSGFLEPSHALSPSGEWGQHPGFPLLWGGVSCVSGKQEGVERVPLSFHDGHVWKGGALSPRRACSVAWVIRPETWANDLTPLYASVICFLKQGNNSAHPAGFPWGLNGMKHTLGTLPRIQQALNSCSAHSSLRCLTLRRWSVEADWIEVPWVLMEPPGHPDCCPRYPSGRGRWDEGVLHTGRCRFVAGNEHGDLIPMAF